MPPAGWFQWDQSALLLSITVQPGAKRDEFVGQHGQAVKVRIHAPPIDGRANERLIEFLASAFGTPRTSVSLIRGAGSRLKKIKIDNPRRIPQVLQPLGLQTLSGEGGK